MRWLAVLAMAVLLSGCVSVSQDKATDCKKIAATQVRDGCLYNTSVRALDPAGCAGITNATVKDACIDDIAVTLLDFDVCAKHETVPRKDACETKVGQAKRKAKGEAPN